MKQILISLIWLLSLHVSCAEQKTHPEIQRYFDAMKKHCSAMDLEAQASLYAEKFKVTFTPLGGEAFTTNETRESYGAYTKRFLDAVTDYSYDHKILSGKINADGSARGKILVTQSFKQDNKLTRFSAVEEVVLQRSGDTFELTEMIVVVQEQKGPGEKDVEGLGEQGGADQPATAQES
ncbi:MAG: hypothetical protein ACSHX0_05460 [Akkermansiaceae bacterium]